MGVFPASRLHCAGSGCLPHARGGVSVSPCLPRPPVASSPRTWGCFWTLDFNAHVVNVFPTHVGVFPTLFGLDWPECGLPHARGGVSSFRKPRPRSTRSSPRTWGCFYPVFTTFNVKKVFPTHVGVFPSMASDASPASSLPHARGGVSSCMLGQFFAALSSPRTWGCFPRVPVRRPYTLVFPTHVGVFLYLFLGRVPVHRLPHARGGVSTCILLQQITSLSSPRTWGCFRFFQV